jgi:nucleotide sugar dehydrogenase
MDYSPLMNLVNILQRHNSKECGKKDGNNMSQAMILGEGDVENPEKRGKYVVSVIGHGRIWLATACLFAETGFQVIIVDMNQHVTNLLKKGRASFDPSLDALVKKHVKNGRLEVINEAREAASASDVIMFVVPTPVNQKKKLNYSQIEKVCKKVGMGLRSGSLIIFESTTGPEVIESVLKEVLEESSGLKAGITFGLAYSPIRTFSTQVLQDLATYPRIVGAINKQSLTAASHVLSTLTK